MGELTNLQFSHWSFLLHLDTSDHIWIHRTNSVDLCNTVTFSPLCASMRETTNGAHLMSAKEVAWIVWPRGARPPAAAGGAPSKKPPFGKTGALPTQIVTGGPKIL